MSSLLGYLFRFYIENSWGLIHLFVESIVEDHMRRCIKKFVNIIIYLPSWNVCSDFMPKNSHSNHGFNKPFCIFMNWCYNHTLVMICTYSARKMMDYVHILSFACSRLLKICVALGLVVTCSLFFSKVCLFVVLDDVWHDRMTLDSPSNFSKAENVNGYVEMVTSSNPSKRKQANLMELPNIWSIQKR